MIKRKTEWDLGFSVRCEVGEMYECGVGLFEVSLLLSLILTVDVC